MRSDRVFAGPFQNRRRRIAGSRPRATTTIRLDGDISFADMQRTAIVTSQMVMATSFLYFNCLTAAYVNARVGYVQY